MLPELAACATARPRSLPPAVARWCWPGPAPQTACIATDTREAMAMQLRLCATPSTSTVPMLVRGGARAAARMAGRRLQRRPLNRAGALPETFTHSSGLFEACRGPRGEPRFQRRGSAGAVGVAAGRGAGHRNPITLHSPLGASLPSNAPRGLSLRPPQVCASLGCPRPAWTRRRAHRAQMRTSSSHVSSRARRRRASRRHRPLPPSFKPAYHPGTWRPRCCLLCCCMCSCK